MTKNKQIKMAESRERDPDRRPKYQTEFNKIYKYRTKLNFYAFQLQIDVCELSVSAIKKRIFYPTSELTLRYIRERKYSAAIYAPSPI